MRLAWISGLAVGLGVMVTLIALYREHAKDKAFAERINSKVNGSEEAYWACPDTFPSNWIRSL